MLCLAAPRSSHTAKGRSCGHALTIQQDALMSGNQLCTAAQMAPNAHIVKGNQCVSTALLLPGHLDKQDTGTMTRVPKTPEQTLAGTHLRAEWKFQHVAMSGNHKLHNVRGMTMVVLDAQRLVLLETVTNSQRLKQRNTHCCLNGTMSATPRTAFIHKTPLLAAKGWCIGSATIAPRDSCTCTK